MTSFSKRSNPDSSRQGNYLARFLRALAFLGLLVVLLIAAAYAPATAATLTVGNTFDSGPGSLRDTIAAAASGDTINFSVSGIINLTSAGLTIGKNLTIDGSGQSISISGNNQWTVFTVSSGVNFSLNHVSVINGKATYYTGGAICNEGGTVTITNCVLSGNLGILGGAIFNDGNGTITITGSTISGNLGNVDGSNGLGGGIYNNSGTTTISNSTLSGNSASNAGAIYNETNAILAITNSTFSGNSAVFLNGLGGGPGGVIYNHGTVTLTNSTLSGNSAANGGVIYSISGTTTTATATLTNNTLYGNTGAFGGGIYNAGLLHMTNNIIAGSIGGVDCYSSTWNTTIATNVNNLIQANTNCQSALNLSGNPLLGTLGNYGGATLTMALLPGSPAIDAGDAAACAAPPVSGLDQRGIARSFGASCDIGAFESRGFIFGTVTGTPQSTVRGTAFGTALGVAVSSANGEPVNGGVVTYSGPGSGAGINPSTGTATVAGGTASLSVTANNTGGGYSVTANAAGVTGSAAYSLTNTNPPTTTVVTPSPNPSAFGQSVSFTATVTASMGTPTGTVDFFDGASLLGSGTLSGGSATLNTATLSVGNRSITAVYSGDTNFGGSTSPASTQTVNQASTTTAVISAPNLSVFGQTVTFTATVTVVPPGAGTPTGTVNFFDGATLLGSGTLSGGVATLNTSVLYPGSRSVSAVYSGDTNFTGSTSAVLTHTVNQAATTTAVTPSVNPSGPGQPVTFTATVSPAAPGAGTRTGMVTFKDGTTTLGTAILDGQGVATFGTAALAVGPHAITAVYTGDTNFTGSTSGILSHIVNQASTTTAVSPSVNPSGFGQPVTFTATVSAVAPASGTPAGTVNFFDGATQLGTAPLNGSADAVFTTSALGGGPHSVTAVYAGDAIFGGSISSPVLQTVNPASTLIEVSSSTNPVPVGQSITFTATVTMVPPATGTPTGIVTFYDGATVLGTAGLNGSGVATFSTNGLSAGTHTITASYAGDANSSTSSSTAVSQVVNTATAPTAVPTLNEWGMLLFVLLAGVGSAWYLRRTGQA